MNNYTHNLTVIILNNDGDYVSNDDLLNEIKSVLLDNLTQIISWNKHKVPISVKWDLKNLSNLEKHFMGDFFSNPIYSDDSIIYEHVKLSLKNIINKQKNNKIHFYISRIINTKKNIPLQEFKEDYY